MSFKSKAPKEDPADKARREQAQEQADRAAEEATSSEVEQQTAALERRFGRLAQGTGIRSPRTPTALLGDLFKNFGGGGSGGSGSSRGFGQVGVRAGGVTGPAGGGGGGAGVGGGGFGTVNYL